MGWAILSVICWNCIIIVITSRFFWTFSRLYSFCLPIIALFLILRLCKIVGRVLNWSWAWPSTSIDAFPFIFNIWLWNLLIPDLFGYVVVGHQFTFIRMWIKESWLLTEFQMMGVSVGQSYPHQEDMSHLLVCFVQDEVWRTPQEFFRGVQQIEEDSSVQEAHLPGNLMWRWSWTNLDRKLKTDSDMITHHWTQMTWRTCFFKAWGWFRGEVWWPAVQEIWAPTLCGCMSIFVNECITFFSHAEMFPHIENGVFRVLSFWHSDFCLFIYLDGIPRNEPHFLSLFALFKVHHL